MTEVHIGNWKDVAAKIHRHCMNNMGIVEGTTEEQTFLALAMVGEAGEVANVQKKIWRDGYSPELAQKLEDEIADVYIYLEHLCESLDIDVDEICAKKLNEVKDRPFARGANQ